MEQNVKNRFDAIFQLYSQAWQHFDMRRTYEWRVCFSLWTALALAVAGVVNSAALPVLPYGVAAPAIALLLIFFLHWRFCSGIAKAHKTDRDMALHYEAILHELSGSKFDENLIKVLAQGRLKWGQTLNWSSGIQLGTTLVLSFVLVFVIYTRMPSTGT